MKIRFYQETDRQAWDEYVLRHRDGTVFHLAGWKSVVENSFGHQSFYLVAEDCQGQTAKRQPDEYTGRNNPIAGVFPLFSVRTFLFGRSMVSLPIVTYGGILADNSKVETALVQKAIELTREHDLDYLEIRNKNGSLPDLPTKELYYNFEKELLPNDDANLKAIPRKSRRMVRVGMSKELETTFGAEELLSEFYELFAYSYRGFGTPVFSRRYLEKLLREFNESCRILIIRKNGVPLSGVMSFFFRDQVVPYYYGAYPASRDYAANDYLYWALMCVARERGCKSFNFGRSKKDTGPYRFKIHWGFEPRPLPYQYYLNRVKEIPNISPDNPKYQKRIELWKKLPLWVTKLVGPRIVKYIP